jgi:hypothetical protein
MEKFCFFAAESRHPCQFSYFLLQCRNMNVNSEKLPFVMNGLTKESYIWPCLEKNVPRRDKNGKNGSKRQ